MNVLDAAVRTTIETLLERGVSLRQIARLTRADAAKRSAATPENVASTQSLYLAELGEESCVTAETALYENP